MFQVSVKYLLRVFEESVKCVSRKFHKKFQGYFKNILMKFCFAIFFSHGSHRSYPSRRRACLNISNNFVSQSRSILVYVSLSKIISVCFGLSWTILVHLGASQCISVYLILSRTIWVYLGLSGTIWNYLGLSGTIWAYLGQSGTIRDYLGLADASRSRR